MKNIFIFFIFISFIFISCSAASATPVSIELVQSTKPPNIAIPNIKMIYESTISDNIETYINKKYEIKTYTTGLFRIYDPLLDVVCYLWISTKQEGNTISCMQIPGIDLRR